MSKLHFDGRGSGPLMVLLHGAYLSHTQWEPNIEPLVHAGHTVLAPDLRGHGESPRDEHPFSVAQFAQDVAALLDEPALVVGVGLGSMVAQALALNHTNKTRALVLADACYGLRSTAYERFKTDFTNGILNLSTTRWQADIFARALTRQSPAARTYVNTQLEAHGRDARNYRALWRALTSFNSLPNLGRISCPTLLLSPAVNVRDARHARVMERGISGAKHAIIPNASHMMNIDNPTAFNNAVIEFGRIMP